MKQFFLLSSLIGFALGSGACERHDWEETKALHEQHGHGGGDHGSAAVDHGAGAGEETKEGEPAPEPETPEGQGPR